MVRFKLRKYLWIEITYLDIYNTNTYLNTKNNM